MKVIVTKGRKFYKGTCKECGCVFKFEEEDIESREEIRDNQGISWRTDMHVICPYCEKETVISK